MGKLVIYTGPMKSGKTTKLIEQYKKTLEKHPKTTYMFKPAIDNRFSYAKVVARNMQDQVLATLLNDIDMLWYFKDMYNYFFIDEFQLLDGNINVIRDLLDLDKNIYVSGLNLTADRKPFGRINDLMCMANKIYILNGKCEVCNKEDKGIYTYYSGTKTADILIGEDNYICVCSKCYNKLKKHTL